MVDRVGQQLGNYRLLRRIGRGKFAEVYLGEHLHLGTLAAIKVLHAHLTNQDSEQFRNEARMIARLEHPHIVRVLEFGVEEHVPFLVMSYASGGSLRDCHPKGTVLPLDTIASYVTQIADALQYAHDQKVIHRDIKPENMLSGRRNEVLLSDFGLATLIESTRSQYLQPTAGSIAYMAPEQIRAHPTPASDQYALSVVAYEWLCGERPFSGSVTEVAVKHLQVPPPSLREKVPSIPPTVEYVVLKALAKDPHDRFEQVSDFAKALEEACKEESSAQTLPILAIGPQAEPGPARNTKEPDLLQPQIDTPGDADHPWNVPFGRNLFFTGRDDLLDYLHHQLTGTNAVALTQSLAITGLGGIGKTQIAIEYAYRYREAYHAVFWVRAASRETLVADFVALASLLHLPGQDVQDQNITVAAVKRWLADHKGWLLILDNADNLSLVADFLPMRGEGHILLTTRAQATGKLASSIAVEKMEQDEGTLLLLRRAKLLTPDAPLDTAAPSARTQAQAIVQALDGLPLALDQAGAYIEETGCSLSQYLELYQRHRSILLNRQSSVSPDYPYTVASTWSISFLKVEQANPAAADLLRLCAFLDPDIIPEAIITEGASVLGEVLRGAAADALLFNEAIQVLRTFSLVKRDAEAKLLHMHRLVQTVLKDGMDPQTQREWAERAVRAVNATFPEVTFNTWTLCELLLPHVQACAKLIEQHSFAFPEAARLLNHAGWYLRERGLYRQGEPLLQHAFALREQSLGAEHLDTASTLDNLAQLYQSEGRYAQAEPLYQRVLRIRGQTVGPEHPQTATILDHLAYLYSLQGKYGEAEPFHQRALAIREQVFGPEHPETAATLDNLATLYDFQGRYKQAEALYQRALTIREQALGPEHPDTGSTLNNLAILYKDEGRYEQAEALYQRALAMYEKALGQDHPDTATILDNLAQLDMLRGQYEQAEALHRRAMTIYEKVLGSDHPDTAINLNNLARIYRLQGQYSQAEPLLQRALAIFQGLDPAHPRIANILDNLARLYQDQGQYAKAEPLLQRALAIREQVLVPDHPNIAESLNNLAELYWEQGQYERAELFYQRALTIREQVLAPDHPSIAESLNNLAVLYDEQGRYEQAEPLYQRTLAIREQALTPDHPDIAESLNNLAYLYILQGKYQQAEPLLQRAFIIFEQVLGPNHPNTAMPLNNLARLYRLQGRYEQAEPLFQRALAIREQARGPMHPHTAITLDQLALLYHAQGRYEQAESLFQRALAIREQARGPMHPDTATSLDHLAQLYEAQGQYEQALPFYQRALTIREQALGPEHPDTVAVLKNYDRLLHKVQEMRGVAETEDEQALTSTEPELVPSAKTTVYPAGLTAREIEVLRLLAKGLTSAQIAEQLILACLRSTLIYARSIVSSASRRAVPPPVGPLSTNWYNYPHLPSFR